LKEKYSITDKQIKEGMLHFGIDTLDFLDEQSDWFVLEDTSLSPGIYKVLNSKVLNDTMSEMVMPRDKIRVNDKCYPIGEMFGINIYEATHIRTNSKIYVSVGELAR